MTLPFSLGRTHLSSGGMCFGGGAAEQICLPLFSFSISFFSWCHREGSGPQGSNPLPSKTLTVYLAEAFCLL